MFQEHFHIFSGLNQNGTLDFCLSLSKYETWRKDYCDIEKPQGSEL